MYIMFYTSFFFFKQKTAYEMRISDWSSDVCSSDLFPLLARQRHRHHLDPRAGEYLHQHPGHRRDQRRQAAYGRRSRESFGRLLGAGLRRSGTGAFPHGKDAPDATRVVAPERHRRGAVHGEPTETHGLTAGTPHAAEERTQTSN